MRLGDLDELFKTINRIRCPQGATMNDGLADACQAVLEAPTVDAVEVVRCAECKRFDPLYGEVGICLLHTAQAHGNVTMQPDDFCSYGERKDGEG